MKNYYNLIKNVCILAHEDIPSAFAESCEPYSEIKLHIRSIVEEVCSKFPWTFRERKYILNTVADQSEYSLPDDLLVSNIMENGVRINGRSSPLQFIFHNDLDCFVHTSGKPSRYSVFSSKIVLDPVPDGEYSIQIKYLTVNYAFDMVGLQYKPNLENESDVTIIPDKFVKVVEWGAYSLLRQNYKPDNKFKFAREKYLEYLLDMQKQDGYGSDSSPVIVLSEQIDDKAKLVKDFFKLN